MRLGLDESSARRTGRSSAPPKREPKYRVIAEVGRGGMANVYLALARGVGGFTKLVVLKFLRPELAVQSEFLTMFTDEARLAACLSHPNIVQTNEIIQRQGAPVIVMEYLEGRTLSELLRRGQRQGVPLSRAMHVAILIDVLRALQYAHDAHDLDGSPLHFVHRDLTPQNILITFDGQVKILDFGIAKFANAVHVTRQGVLKGKVRFMAPEQMMSAPVDRRADLYSIGVLLWQALTGEELWHDRTDMEVMQIVVGGIFPSARKVAPDLPEAIDAVFAKSLAAEPGDRYATAAAFEEALAAFAPLWGPRPEARDFARYVDELFHDDRQHTKEVIAQSVGRAENACFTGTGEVAFPTRTGMRAMAIIDVMGSDPDIVFDDDPQPPVPRRRNPWGLGMLLFLAVLGSALGIYRAREVARVSAASSASSSPHGRVRIHLSATPDEARIYLDGAALGSNPYEEQRSADGQRHWVRAELDGHVTRQEDFLLESDIVVSIALQRAAVAPASSDGLHAATPERAEQAVHAVARRRPESAPGTTGTLSAPAQDCDPPYFIDPEGIRRVRPGCS